MWCVCENPSRYVLRIQSHTRLECAVYWNKYSSQSFVTTETVWPSSVCVIESHIAHYNDQLRSATDDPIILQLYFKQFSRVVPLCWRKSHCASGFVLSQKAKIRLETHCCFLDQLIGPLDSVITVKWPIYSQIMLYAPWTEIMPA